MEIVPVSLVLNYQQTGKYALNVVAGSIMTRRILRGTPVYFSKNLEQLLTHINEAQRQSEKVVVGWSFYSPQFTTIIDDLTVIKQQTNSANVIHLAGGVHATAEPLQTLNAGFDLVAVGEGEQIICDLLAAIATGQDIKTTRGIAYLDAEALVKNGKGETVDLNDYPPCASRYRKFGPIEITRGCVYACKFCQTPFVNKARFRHRGIENIAHYVRIMAANGLRDYRFLTPTALSRRKFGRNMSLKTILPCLKNMSTTTTLLLVVSPVRRRFWTPVGGDTMWNQSSMP